MSPTPRRRPAVRVFALAVLASCGGGGTQASQPAGARPAGGEQLGAPQHLSNVDAGAPGASEDAGAAAAAPARPAVVVVTGTPTPLPAGLRPRVAIASPRADQMFRTNRVEVRLRVTDWPAPQDGRHIHLIRDNEPYIRVDDPTRPVVLENVPEGTHVLRAFPGWHTHESVKTEGAFAMVVFHVARRTEGFQFDRAAPLLTYSRPKGDYNGADAEHILLDFYLTNVPNNQLAADGFRVRYRINQDVTGEITSWVPHFIDHLPDGQHRITLDLLRADGQPAPGPFNHAERDINVNRGAAGGGGGHGPAHEHAADAGAHDH